MSKIVVGPDDIRIKGVDYPICEKTFELVDRFRNMEREIILEAQTKVDNAIQEGKESMKNAYIELDYWLKRLT